MEMDTSTKPPEAPSITVEDKNTSASRLREVTLDTLQTLEQPEERDVWSMEEGDDSVDKSNEEGYTRLNGEASAKLQVSGNRHLEVEQAAEQDENFHVPEGFHQGPSPGCSTLPLEKKSFDHLRSSKYSTVSYRRICRGNTRQKIEEFEYKIMNS
uniref:Uncharacterized LOC113122976 n=1 Tax=Mastacembelus armatus TaxID=205130 RepID=A0A7N8Y1A6_9TELE